MANPGGRPARRPEEQTNRLAEAFALTLSEGEVDHILELHVADERGYCKGCRFPTSPAPRWPCRLWEIGTESVRIRHSARPPRSARSA